MKIGLFGGTFDPVHVGHMAMVDVALETGLDRLVVMPCHVSPHKLAPRMTAWAGAEARVAMLRMALGNEPRVEISRFEVDRPPPSYTRDTLARLRANHPGAVIRMLVGWDQFTVLNTWEGFADWSRDVEFLVFRRGPASDAGLGWRPRGVRFEVADAAIPRVSSSQIRGTLKAGGDAGAWLHPAVAVYIRDNGLYRGNAVPVGAAGCRARAKNTAI